MEFAPEIISSLKHYVYLYRDPDTGYVFYVGRGKGNRVFAHLKDAGETRKVEVIKRLALSGKSPIIDILRSGMSENEAKMVEAAVIDLLGLNQLTNNVHGNHKDTMPRISAKALIEAHHAKPVHISHKVILLRINQLYREDMTRVELYEATRGVWGVSNRCNKAEYAMAVYQGIVKEVYKISSWHEAGSTTYTTRTRADISLPGRKEFEGQIAPSPIRSTYIGKSVRQYFKRGMRSSFVYENI